MTELDEIRARAAAATVGPWIGGNGYVHTVPEFDLHRFDIMPETVARGMEDVDAEFIAHAREDIPRLLAAVDAVRSLIEDAETNRGGSSMYCKVTTYELRQALGMKGAGDE